MAVTVHRDTHELEFTWTAPGDDYDKGNTEKLDHFGNWNKILIFVSALVYLIKNIYLDILIS